MHPILTCAADIASAVKDVDGVEPVFMSTSEKETALLALTAVRAQLEALTLRVLAAADDVAEAHGARDPGAWLAAATRTTRAVASRELRLARALEAHGAVREALGRGEVLSEQALVVVDAVDALPADVDAGVRDEARRVLLRLAEVHDARDLRRLGKRVLDVVAPEVGESHEARILEQEEAVAAATASFTLVDDGAGRCHGRFTAPTHVGAMLRRHLLALANPARHGTADLTTADGGGKPPAQRLGEAFTEYVERYPTDRTPDSGGVSATVVVTMTLEQLLGGDAPATLDDGSRTPPGRRVGWRARPASSPRSSAPPRCPSTSAARPGCSPDRSASPSACATAAAPPRAATCPRRGATPTTTGCPGPATAAPT